jgi:serine protease Do
VQGWGRNGAAGAFFLILVAAAMVNSISGTWFKERFGVDMKMVFSSGSRSAVAFLIVCAFTVPALAGTNPPAQLKVDDSGLNREIRDRTSFSPVVKKVGPSVVNIYSTVVIKEKSMRGLFGDDPTLRRFFGDNSPKTSKAQSLGSGAIVTADGYILTANHVVESAEKVKVALASGEKEFEAKIIGTDAPTDIAVLKIDAKDLPTITVGDSDKLEVGDTVLALGNPFELGRTVTQGIVSATGRGVGINLYEDFIQTDAAINMGNSGGPLIDAQGRLIGVNTMIFSRSGGFSGIGFAVPSNLARYVMDRLITEGKVTRGYLGLHLQPDLNGDLARQFNLPNTEGALVTMVEPGSPAAKGGFKDGDFITEVNGKKVADMRQLRLIVSQTVPGSKVNAKLIRDGKPKTVTATVGQMPEGDLAKDGSRPRSSERNQGETDALDGVEVTDLDAEARQQYNIPSSVRGVLVTSVDENSNSADAGLHSGDVIVEIDRHPVNGASEAVTLSEKSKADRILLRVWTPNSRGGQGNTRYLTVDNTKRK